MLVLKDAIWRAIDECIEEGTLAEFLKTRRDEVVNALLTEYDEEKVMQDLREEAYEDGKEAGSREGRMEGIRVLIETCGELGIPKEDTALKLKDKFSLSAEEAEGYIMEYWKE